MSEPDTLYNELAFYTLAHHDPAFIHQYVVDAYTAQTADETTRPVALVFALVGLYLHVEKAWSGRQVQRGHMKMAASPKAWVKPPLPQWRGEISIHDVLAAEPGSARDALIDRWCQSVWQSWNKCHGEIIAIAKSHLGTD